MADGPVLAGITGALVHVDSAVHAIEPGRTLAGIRGDQVAAGGPVVAGPGRALVDLHFAVDSCGGREGREGRGGGCDDDDCGEWME